MDNADIARAFSSHRFEEALPHLAEDVVWDLVGSPPITGRAAVEAVCRESTTALSQSTTDFREFRVIADGDTVAVDSVASYTEPEGVSVVSSCDLYDFAGGLVTRIRSYTVELEGPSANRS